MTLTRQSARDRLLQCGYAHARQTRLVVDFYRIRRRLAYPLPVRECAFPDFPTRLGTWYPWDCWLAWAIEERITSLGWAATFDNDPRLRALTEADLLGLSDWRLIDPDKIDGLATAHFVRTMCAAVESWPWLSDDTQTAINRGLNYLLDYYGPWLQSQRDWWRRRKETPDHPDFANPLHNIHFIETVGVCLAARHVGHDVTKWLEPHVQQFALAVLDQHAAGVSEGVSYDGYILDFLIDWLREAPAALQGAVAEHPEIDGYLEQPAILAAPGRPLEVAPLGDVEAVEMPFHASALAKWRSMTSCTTHDRQITQCDVGGLRADALAAIVNGPELNQDATATAATRTRAAVVLRTGHGAGDMAVAMSAHSAAMGHLHHDNGSIVVALGGQWMISDPGYQQYMATSERAFTVGPTAHNAPVIDGAAQVHRHGRIIEHSTPITAEGRVSIDLRGCYERPLSHCARTLWLTDQKTAIIADAIAGDRIESIAYHWHGHRDAAWWVEKGVALIHLEGVSMWVRCMNVPLLAGQVDRRPGSRGHLTLSVQLPAASNQTVWWAFSASESYLHSLSLRDGDLFCPHTQRTYRPDILVD